MSPPRGCLLVVLATAVSLTGCGGPAGTSPVDDTTAALAALDWSAPGVDGGTISGAEHAGRDVVLWLWAPW